MNLNLQNNITRSHTCGELRSIHEGQSISLCGWVGKRRNLGGLIFIDLRDRYGLVQIVFDPQLHPKVHQQVETVRAEYVLRCEGTVRRRPNSQANSAMPTGEIEVLCTAVSILSEAEVPPFVIPTHVGETIDATENLRLKYRYLDLRNPSLQKNLEIRHRMLSTVRNYLDQNQFLEIETPILYKSTPEGARDFIVPSRIVPQTFYALPQSPQTLKQLLMIAGMDRYYQIARCFRDEDLRADRQPEFTQIDIETSFLDEESFFKLMEGMISKIWEVVKGKQIKLPFPRMHYQEAMNRFGSDKPDIRFGLELINLTNILKGSEFQVFKRALTLDSRGFAGSIRGICVPQSADRFSRKDIDDLQASIGSYGAKGLLWIKVLEQLEIQSPAAKFLSPDEKQQILEAFKAKAGDILFVVADAKNKVVFDSLGALRLMLANKLGELEKVADQDAFLWVTHFPLLEYNDEEKRYFAAHHPFTSPKSEQVQQLIQWDGVSPLDHLEASAYDMVLNGVEIGGGSLRIFRPETQNAMFKALGMSEVEAKKQFGFFLEALKFGTPPHGGMALGVERLTALLCGVGPIRDVMAFPKTQKGSCLMSESPSSVSEAQLNDLQISIRSLGEK